MVCDSFEDGRHLGGRKDEAQITGRGLMKRDYVDAPTINLNFQPVDLVIVLQHSARGLVVAFDQGVNGAFKRAFRLAAKQEEAVAQVVQFVVYVPVVIHLNVLPFRVAGTALQSLA
jgi:hypothetical protein